MIHNDTWYEVCTHWGWFRLDEGAYCDYLKGKLWITWKPGHPQPAPIPENADELLPVSVSDEAVRLRDRAGKGDVFATLRQVASGEQMVLPYKKRMSGIPIDEMNLSVRSLNGLMRAGASTYGRLHELMVSEKGLRGVRNLGIKSEKEISTAFVSACYQQLDQTERAVFWQQVINQNERELML